MNQAEHVLNEEALLQAANVIADWRRTIYVGHVPTGYEIFKQAIQVYFDHIEILDQERTHQRALKDVQDRISNLLSSDVSPEQLYKILQVLGPE